MNDLQLLENTLIEIGCKYELIEVCSENEFETEGYISDIRCDTKIILDNGIGHNHSNCIFYFYKGMLQGHGCW